MLPRASGVEAAFAVCVALSACGHGETEITPHSVAGPCTISEPGTRSALGTAAYVEHHTPTTGGVDGPGSLGLTITCLTTGLASDQVILILPNLRRATPVPLGDYHIHDPGDSIAATSALTDPRLAWARVKRGTASPLLFTGQGGRVTLTRAGNGVVEGAYQVALAANDTAFAIPGARGEVGAGEAAAPSDSTSRLTVIGGAFVAPAKEAEWRGGHP